MILFLSLALRGCLGPNASLVPVRGATGTLHVDVGGSAEVALPLFNASALFVGNASAAAAGAGLLWGSSSEERANRATVAFVTGYLRGFDVLELRSSAAAPASDPGGSGAAAAAAAVAAATADAAGAADAGAASVAVASWGAINASWDSATGVLSLVGDAPLSAYREALGIVHYRTKPHPPGSLLRAVVASVCGERRGDESAGGAAGGWFGLGGAGAGAGAEAKAGEEGDATAAAAAAEQESVEESRRVGVRRIRLSVAANCAAADADAAAAAAAAAAATADGAGGGASGAGVEAATVAAATCHAKAAAARAADALARDEQEMGEDAAALTLAQAAAVAARRALAELDEALNETRSALAATEALIAAEAGEGATLLWVLRALLAVCVLAMAATMCTIKRSNGYSAVRGIVLADKEASSAGTGEGKSKSKGQKSD